MTRLERTARALGLATAVLAVALLTGTEAVAQGTRTNFSAGATGGGTRTGSTPFSTIYRRPAISPYNQLQQNTFNPLQNQNVYQQSVMPLIQQQQQQMELIDQSRRVNKIQNQVQQIQRSTTARQVDESIRPTGHRATYMDYSHFYPR